MGRRRRKKFGNAPYGATQPALPLLFCRNSFSRLPVHISMRLAVRGGMAADGGERYGASGRRRERPGGNA